MTVHRWGFYHIGNLMASFGPGVYRDVENYLLAVKEGKFIYEDLKTDAAIRLHLPVR